MLCGDLNGKEGDKWGGNPKKRGYVYMYADSLRCTAETNTMLLSNDTPIKF